MALVEVKVPDIGDFKDVEVIEVLVKAGLVSKHRSGREQLVRGKVNQLRRAHELLDDLETVWRTRLERFDGVLNETTGKESE